MTRFFKKSIAKMKNFIRLLIGAGENCSDIRYATGISTPDDFLFFSFGEKKCAIMSALEIDRARHDARPGVTVCSETDYHGPKRLDIISAIADECRCRNFAVPDDFPFGVAEKMQQSGFTVIPHAASFFPQREFKSAAEAELITHSQRAAEAGLLRAVDILKSSSIDGKYLSWQGKTLTSEILRAEIDCEILRNGALPTGTICAGGTQGAQPHHFGSGPLMANMPIVMDIFPRSPQSGYWGDLTRTVVRGKAAPIVRKAYEAVLEAREHCKKLIRIGAYGAEIHCAAEAILEGHGFMTGAGDQGQFGFFHGLGHGVGLDIHENPRLSPRARTALQGGEVVTVEPGLYYPEWGGIRLEDLVYLPPSGAAAICLTEAPDFLEI
ncbi:MAG: aminopeptidase P family protein [Lentisphaerae bacterium]|nr:aminopeptidase P family protein [Lentisphaerota bacterium]